MHPGDTLRKNILLVDDEPMVRDTMRLLLEMDGYQVRDVSNGKEALGLFAKQPFGLVITDYVMPEIRGDELARRIKQLAPAQPILMVSGFADKIGNCTHIDAVLDKPFSLPDLRRVVAELVAREREWAP